MLESILDVGGDGEDGYDQTALQTVEVVLGECHAILEKTDSSYIHLYCTGYELRYEYEYTRYLEVHKKRILYPGIQVVKFCSSVYSYCTVF